MQGNWMNWTSCLQPEEGMCSKKQIYHRMVSLLNIVFCCIWMLRPISLRFSISPCNPSTLWLLFLSCLLYFFQEFCGEKGSFGRLGFVFLKILWYLALLLISFGNKRGMWKGRLHLTVIRCAFALSDATHVGSN